MKIKHTVEFGLDVAKLITDLLDIQMFVIGGSKVEVCILMGVEYLYFPRIHFSAMNPMPVPLKRGGCSEVCT